MLVQVVEEVGLALELAGEFLCLHEAKCPLLTVHDLLTLHFTIVRIFYILIRQGMYLYIGIAHQSGTVRDIQYG